MNHDEAIRMLRDAYKYTLSLRADELEATIWAQTLGTLWLARQRVINNDECWKRQ